MKLLILGENNHTTKQLSETLKKEGFSNVILEPSKLKETILAEKLPILIIEMSVFANFKPDFLIEMKEEHKKLSVVVLSKDFNDKDSEILVLNAGADDYTAHPYLDGSLSKSSLKILIARIRARLRSGGTNIIEISDLRIDPDEEKIFYHSKEIELKGKPFEVLTHLAKHRGQIVSKEQLLDAIWEEPELVTPNVIEVAINQIRQKMDKPLGIGTIETVRRRGYRFCFPNCSEDSTMVDL
ncbi:MAG: homeostatic response regulator transcription factor HsrA [Helicobacteraceae bacterium]